MINQIKQEVNYLFYIDLTFGSMLPIPKFFFNER